MKTLYCVACGQNMHEQFAAECQANKYNYEEAVFVLAAEQAETWPVPALSFDALVRQLLRAGGKAEEELSTLAQQLVLSGLCKEMKNNGQLNFFSGLDESSAFGEAVFSFITELAEAAIMPEDFLQTLPYLADGKTIRAKDKEIATLYYAYRQVLQEQNLQDKAGLYQQAITLLREQDLALSYKKIYFSGFYKFNALQLELIKQLSRYCAIDICLCYQKESVYAASQRAYQDLLGLGFTAVFPGLVEQKDPALQTLSAHLFRFASEQSVCGGKAITAKRYANRRQEMQEVVADIKAKLLQGAKTSDFLLSLRNLALYPGLKREFDLAGVPVAIPEAARLSLQPAARLVSSILQIAAGEIKPGLTNFFGNFFIQPNFALATPKIQKLLAEKFYLDFEQAQALLQKHFWDQADFQAFWSEQSAFLATFPQQASVEKYNALLLAFLQELPVAQTLGELYQAGKLGNAELKLLATSYEKVVAKLAELGQAFVMAGEAQRKLALPEYKQLLEKSFVDTSFLVGKLDQDGICVKSIAEPMDRTFPYVYLLGLKEGELPLFNQENWLYDDIERGKLQQLGVLAAAGDKANEELFFFYQAVCMAQKQLNLSVALADGEIVSAYLEEVLRLAPQLLVEERAANQILPGVEKIANKDNLACLLVGEGIADDWLDEYLGSDFARRCQSELPVRQGRFAGQLLSEQVVQAVNTLLELAFDASRLESYAFCPFKFLLEYVWRPAAWSTASEEIRADLKGNIYHDCLKNFLQKHQGQAMAFVEKGQLHKQLEQVFDRTVQQLVEKGRLETSYLSEQEFKEMKERLAFWLDAELEYQSKNKGAMYPERFEWGFENLELATVAGQARLKGRIDRIDTDGEHYFVTDYKIKGAPKKLDVQKGLDLQIPIYLLAVEKFLGQPLGGGYFSVENAKREGGFWLNSAKEKICFQGQISAEQKALATADWAKYKQQFTQTLVQLVEQLSAGNFTPAPKGECPFYCPGQGLCRLAQSKDIGCDNE